jgi:hypothetical protein
MPGTQIGFSKPPQEETWKKTVGEVIGTFTKGARTPNGWYLYNCECRKGDLSASTGMHSEQELTREQVEQVPKFLALFEQVKNEAR